MRFIHALLLLTPFCCCYMSASAFITTGEAPMIDSAIDTSSIEQSYEMVNIYFNHSSDIIDPNETGNRVAITQLDQTISNILSSDSLSLELVYVESFASPDGGGDYNFSLAKRRLLSTLDLIAAPPLSIPDSLIYATSDGVDWRGLRDIVASLDSSIMSGRDEVLYILDNIPIESWRREEGEEWLTLVDSRKKQLMDLMGGEPYRYMLQSLFPQLRRSCVTVVYSVLDTSSEQISKEVAKPQMEPAVALDPQPIIGTQEEPIFRVEPLFAVKSNLLFDLLTLINVEVEVPIRRRYSIAAELTFPWWVWDNHRADSRRNRVELINGVLEGRYWWGDRVSKPILTGWFTGLYVGGGLYDFEHRAKGYQGEFFVAAGVSGGYAHTIGRTDRLRLEYSLGVGFLKTRYRYYEAIYCCNEVWHPVELRRGTYGWFGPTRLKVSLSWLLNYKRRVSL